ncbi:MAG: hypothetical protein AAFO83_03815 [Cyanobacteria bacterium J06607_13]
MKLVQIIRPLFLMAVGLHALALFLPIGESEPEVVEDVDISELSEEAPKSRLPAPLPVPDPNVADQAKPAAQAKPGGGAAKPAIAGSPAAVASRSGATTAAVAARPAATAAPRPAAARPAAPRPAAAPSISVASPSAQSTPPVRPSATPTVQPTPPAASPPPSSSLPVLNPSDDAEDSASASSANSGSSSNATGSGTSASGTSGRGSISIAALLEKVTQQVPASLRDLASEMDKSLTYDPENTDDDSAEQAREDWKANIQKQANVGTIERIEPTELDGLAEVTYPLEVSEIPDRQPLSLCLEQEPHDAEIGVLFDADGDIVDRPTVIRSTGYSALNEQIQATVAAYEDFPSDRSSKAYNFEIEVEYDDDACVSLEDLKE